MRTYLKYHEVEERLMGYLKNLELKGVITEEQRRYIEHAAKEYANTWYIQGITDRTIAAEKGDFSFQVIDSLDR